MAAKPKTTIKTATAPNKADTPSRVTVSGTGTVRLRTAETVRRVARGEPVEVTPAEVDYLTRAGIEFTPEK